MNLVIRNIVLNCLIGLLLIFFQNQLCRVLTLCQVIGDDTSALESVLVADVERYELLREEKELLASQDKSEATDKRLAEIYTKLTEMEADAAPAL